jgi:hypothetical protein
MYLEIERKLYTFAIGALALASVLILTLSYPMPSEIFVRMARSVGSAKVVILGEWVFRQFLTALICLVPLKLTRHRLSVLDSLLLGCMAMMPTLLRIPCELESLEWVAIATAPPLFMLVFWMLRSVPLSSWLDRFYSDQKPWLSVVFAAMFALQISLAVIMTASKGTLLTPSILIALAGAALALLARRFDQAPLWALASGVFAYDLSLYVSAWPKISGSFAFSCSDLR